MNSLKLWTQCCLKNHPSHSQKKRCVVILTCRVIFPKYHRIKVNKKKCQNVVNNYQARVILRPIPNVNESALFLLMTSGLFFPASFTIQAICQGAQYTFGQTQNPWDFNQKLRRKIAPSFQPFQATLVDPGRHSDLHHTSCYLEAWFRWDPRDVFFALVIPFVKLKDLGKGTPSQMAEKTPEKWMSEDE